MSLLLVRGPVISRRLRKLQWLHWEVLCQPFARSGQKQNSTKIPIFSFVIYSLKKVHEKKLRAKSISWPKMDMRILQRLAWLLKKIKFIVTTLLQCKHTKCKQYQIILTLYSNEDISSCWSANAIISQALIGTRAPSVNSIQWNIDKIVIFSPCNVCCGTTGSVTSESQWIPFIDCCIGRYVGYLWWI